MLKNNKAITLIALIIMIIVLLILAGVGTTTGLRVIKENKYYKAVSEMKVMQAKVNELYEDYKYGEIEINNYGEEIEVGTDIYDKAMDAYQTVLNNNGITNKAIGKFEDYRYFSVDEILDKFDVDSIDLDYIINIKARTAILLEGIQNDDTLYHSIGEIEEEPYNVEYIEPTVEFIQDTRKYYIDNNENAKISATINISDYGDTDNNTEIRFSYAISNSSTNRPSNWTSFENGEKIEEEESVVGDYYIWVKIEKYDNTTGTYTPIDTKLSEVNKVVEPIQAVLSNNGGLFAIATEDDTYIKTNISSTDDTQLKEMQYAWSTSNTNEPIEFTKCQSGDTLANKIDENFRLYLWTKVIDIDGYITTNVSNVFDVGLYSINLEKSTDTWTNEDIDINISYNTNVLTQNLAVGSGPNLNYAVVNRQNINSLVTTVENSGYLYVVVEDRAGNKVTNTLQISNIDKSLPTATLNPNGGTYTLMPNETETNISTTVTASDTGGSNLNTLKYAWSNSNETEPTSWTTFENGATIEKNGASTGQYLWTYLTDNAGNENKQVSKIFEIKNVATIKIETALIATSTAKFLDSSINRRNIESLKFQMSLDNHTTDETNCWDVSSTNDKSILAWYLDEDSDGYYEVTIGTSNEKLYANPNSYGLCAYIGYTGDDTTCIYGIENLDTSYVTNMSFMFSSCGYTAMTSLDLGDKFDTSKVTDMSSMFSGCGYKAMTNLNLGNKFDTSSVTSMSFMFDSCGYTAMTSLDLGDKFDTSSVTNMYSMFNSCGYKAMTSLDLGDKFDTSSVTNMGTMFDRCGYTAMTSLNLGDKFDTSSVTNMSNMFNSCGYKKMTSLDLGDKFDTSSVTNMFYMFSKCGYTAMTNLNLGDKFDTSSVTNMSYMFEECGYIKMTSLDLGDKFDTSKVTNMYTMFYECGYKAMTSLDLGDKFDTSKVTDMYSMFSSCGYTKMISLDLGDKFDTSSVTTMSNMFRYCGYTKMTSLDLGDNFDTSSVTDMSYMFAGCGYTAMTSLDLGDKFDTSSVTDMSVMFNVCGNTAMTSINLGDKFDTSSVISMRNMFAGCGFESMTSLDLGDKFDTSSVTNMYSMFDNCGHKKMTNLDLGDKFDTSKVTSMRNMFYSCGYKAMISLDLGDKFDTSKVTNMERMFENCGYTAMTSLDLGNKFDTSSVTNMLCMFSDCGYIAMTSLNIRALTFNTSILTNYNSIFSGCGTSSCVVYVKDDNAKTFVTTNKNSLWNNENIQIWPSI